MATCGSRSRSSATLLALTSGTGCWPSRAAMVQISGESMASAMCCHVRFFSTRRAAISSAASFLVMTSDKQTSTAGAN
ncbi:Uncharacterised protein [Mycobacteroides abscessus subsp. abscessus]|nr:Uncharacterised protein [Mycobacteroides abscessus subsp. abscessus]